MAWSPPPPHPFSASLVTGDRPGAESHLALLPGLQTGIQRFQHKDRGKRSQAGWAGARLTSHHTRSPVIRESIAVNDIIRDHPLRIHTGPVCYTTADVGVMVVGGSNEQWHSLFEGMHRLQPIRDEGTLHNSEPPSQPG